MMVLALSMLAVVTALVVFALLRGTRAPQLPSAVTAAYRRSLQRYDIGAVLAFHKAHFGGAAMEIVFDAPATPDDVTAFVRQVPQSDQFILGDYLPDRLVDDNEVDFEELVRTNRTARFRSYDGRLHISERDTGARKKVKLPPLSSGLSSGEYERLQREFARTGGTNGGALARAIYNDAEQLTREVRNRMELARGDVLTDFVLSMSLPDEPGAGLTADYGAPAGHLVAPSVQWTTANLATMTPLTNLVEWYDVQVANGVPPVEVVLSNTRLRILTRSAEVINAVYGSTAGRTMVSVGELTALIQSLMPTIRRVRNYDARVDVDGTITRILPDDRVLMLAEPENLGYTAWGLTATALELVNANESDLSWEDAPGIVGVIEKVGPPYREFAFVDAVGMPVITQPRGLLVADVA